MPEKISGGKRREVPHCRVGILLNVLSLLQSSPLVLQREQAAGKVMAASHFSYRVTRYMSVKSNEWVQGWIYLDLPTRRARLCPAISIKRLRHCCCSHRLPSEGPAISMGMGMGIGLSGTAKLKAIGAQRGGRRVQTPPFRSSAWGRRHASAILIVLEPPIGCTGVDTVVETHVSH